jgi:hypothetical protein
VPAVVEPPSDAGRCRMKAAGGAGAADVLPAGEDGFRCSGPPALG